MNENNYNFINHWPNPIYAIKIEKSSKNRTYKALCDLNEKISCSKAFSSKYGNIMGIKNSIIGSIIYSAIIILSILNFTTLIFYLSILLATSSIILAYFQYKIRTFCVVCAGIYIINILIFILAL